MTSTQHPQAPYKQLRRPTTDRMVAGVASGLGRYFAVDPTLVRVVFAVATLLTGGIAAAGVPDHVVPDARGAGRRPRLAAPARRPQAAHRLADRPQPARPPHRGRTEPQPPTAGVSRAHSHSMVPGGLLVTSSTTRLTSGTSLVIRVEIRAITSYGSRDQSAVIASSLETGRSTTGCP